MHHACLGLIVGCHLQRGMLHTAAEGGTAAEGDRSFLTCCWAFYGRGGLQDASASLLEDTKAPTPPGRVPVATVQACFRCSNLFWGGVLMGLTD